MTDVILTAGEIEAERSILWRDLAKLKDEHTTVLLLTRHAGIVTGWMSRRFLGKPTFWSWSERVSKTLDCGRVVPGFVEAIAFSEIIE